MCHYTPRKEYPGFQAQQLPPPPTRLTKPPSSASRLDSTCNLPSHEATVSCAGAVSNIRRRFPHSFCRRRAAGPKGSSIDTPAAEGRRDNAGRQALVEKGAAAARPRHDSQCGGGNGSGNAAASPATALLSPAPLQRRDAAAISVARRPAERTRRCGGGWRRWMPQAAPPPLPTPFARPPAAIAASLRRRWHRQRPWLSRRPRCN